ncbi:MAG: hypothetical protein Q4D79_03715 [Propionibacteriaceae bacterium]|nr:hypothetical protein [Propionibacteriaceae bacterium]
MVKLLRPVFGQIRLLDVLLAAACFLLGCLMLVGGPALELLPGLTASERAILTARLPWMAALMAVQGLLLVCWHARP